MTATCDFEDEDCATPSRILGLCHRHYMRLHRAGGPRLQERRVARAVARSVQPLCKALDINATPCDRVASWGAYCSKHHRRVRLYGDARVAHTYVVSGVQVTTVLVHEMRKLAADGSATLLELSEKYRLPLDYVAAVVGAPGERGRGWHNV